MFEAWFPYLGLKIETLNKVAFNIFGFEVYWYGILIALGVILGLFTVQKIAKQTGQNPEIYVEAIIYCIIFGLIFARVYYVIFSWEYFKNHLNEVFYIRNGGIAIYGGIIGGLISSYIYTKVKKINFFEFTDTAVVGLLIGQIIGRFGNFINREAFGGYTDSIFAMRYLKDQVGHLTQDVLDNVINIDGIEYIQVHPTFIYEAFWNLISLIIILIYNKNKKFKGEVTALYCTFYGIGRFLIESLRTDSLIIYSTNIRISQLISLILVIISVTFTIIKRHKLKSKT